MPTNGQQGEGYIREMQIARGIGILLVTIGHSDPIMEVFPLFWQVIYSFHMPLFFFMSGFFSLRLVNRPWLAEVLPRTARLYVPYIIISLSYGFIKFFVPGLKRPVVPEDVIGQILLYPFDNPALFLWFLYILLLMKLLSPLFRGRLPLVFLPFFILSACWYGSVDFLGIWALLKHLLYYNCGLLLAEHHTLFFAWLRNRGVRVVVILLFPLLFFLSANSSDGPLPVLTALAGIWSILSISFLAIPERVGRFLEYCGTLSLEIYLLQYYFVFPVLFAFNRLGMEPSLIVLCTFVVGLSGPILVSRLVLDKSRLLALVFSGRVRKTAQQA